VVIRGTCYEDSEEHARRLASKHEWRFLHAFDDPEVIAGQGTIAIDLLPLKPDVVLVPIGGGGLAAGMSIVLKNQNVRVVGVQVKGVDSMYRALRGQFREFDAPLTAADGLRVRKPGGLALEICSDHLDDVVLVSENDVRRTLVELVTQDRIVAEGAGATAVAALHQFRGERAIAVVSGGNIDAQHLFEFHRELGLLA
jgi:threonine dehydratase